MSAWAFVALCLVVPGVWGMVMHRVFARRDAGNRVPPPSGRPPTDYSI